MSRACRATIVTVGAALDICPNWRRRTAHVDAERHNQRVNSAGRLVAAASLATAVTAATLAATFAAALAAALAASAAAECALSITRFIDNRGGRARGGSGLSDASKSREESAGGSIRCVYGQAPCPAADSSRRINRTCWHFRGTGHTQPLLGC